MKLRHFLKLALLLMAGAVRGAPPPAPGTHAPRYRYVDLGTIGGTQSGGNSIRLSSGRTASPWISTRSFLRERRI